MSYTRILPTKNSNILLFEDSTGLVYLQAAAGVTNNMPILVRKYVWLECHDDKLNTHKYYNIIETYKGIVVAFWGRIFKEGIIRSKFGEIKNIYYNDLLKSKLAAYKIMYRYEMDPILTVPYNEPYFHIELDISPAIITSKSAILDPSPSTNPIPMPLKHTKEEIEKILEEEAEKKRKENLEKLTDGEKIILSKLNTLYNFAKDIYCNRIPELNKMNNINHIWSIELSAEKGILTEKIKDSIGTIINNLEINLQITKNDLINCYKWNNELNEINEIYKQVLQIKG